MGSFVNFVNHANAVTRGKGEGLKKVSALHLFSNISLKFNEEFQIFEETENL